MRLEHSWSRMRLGRSPNPAVHRWYAAYFMCGHQGCTARWYHWEARPKSACTGQPAGNNGAHRSPNKGECGDHPFGGPYG